MLCSRSSYGNPDTTSASLFAMIVDHHQRLYTFRSWKWCLIDDPFHRVRLVRCGHRRVSLLSQICQPILNQSHLLVSLIRDRYADCFCHLNHALRPKYCSIAEFFRGVPNRGSIVPWHNSPFIFVPGHDSSRWAYT